MNIGSFTRQNKEEIVFMVKAILNIAMIKNIIINAYLLTKEASFTMVCWDKAEVKFIVNKGVASLFNYGDITC